MSEKIQGNKAIPGIGIGKIMKVSQDLEEYLGQYVPGNPEEETAKVESAIEAVTELLENSVEAMQAAGQTEQAEIMEAHSFLIQDPMLTDGMLDKVKALGNAPAAVLSAAAESAELFENMDDEYLRERSADVLDIGRRIAKFILGVKEQELGDEPVVLCGFEIEPSAIAGVPDDKLAGVIMGQGSTTCHAVIIAKSRAIPTVVGLGEAVNDIQDGAAVLLDGSQGLILVEPEQSELESYKAKLKAQQEEQARYEAIRDLPAETTDGVSVQLAANIGLPEDAEAAAKYGNRGVGLFRSEFLFMGRDSFPDEELQLAGYKRAIEACQGELCVIRTMDIGGDKPLPYLNIPKEENPFLGYRAIRICLDDTAMFKTQLRAILRAGAYGRAAIMLPMVTGIAEVKAARELLDTAISELEAEGKDFGRDVQLGIMVETPAAAVTAHMLAKYVDFFSIGTNDLVQYTLAVDRVNSKISKLYDHFHPAVLSLIQQTINAARDNGIWVGMCGEMASDPYAAAILMAMGISELSMSAPSIPRVKEKLRDISAKDAKAHLEKVMEFDTGAAVREYLMKCF